MTALESSGAEAADRQRSDIELRILKGFELRASIDVSSRGLLAITVLVSGIILSTAVLVRSAVREGRRFPNL